MKKAKQVASWHDIPDKLFNKFERMVYALQDRIIPRDCDGDTPIQVLVCNRLKYEPIHWFLVPNESTYDGNGQKIKLTETEEDKLDMERERWLMANLSMAHSAIEQHFKLKHYRIQKRLEERKPLRSQIKNACLLCRKGMGFKPFVPPLDPAYPSSIHENGENCKAFVQRRKLWYEEKGKNKHVRG